MDHIYLARDHKIYNVKEDMAKLVATLDSNDYPRDFNEISKVCNISQEKVESVSLELCKLYEDYGEDLIDEENSELPDPYHAFSNAALQLNCLKTIRDTKLDHKESRLKYTKISQDVLNVEEQDLLSLDILPLKEYVLNIRFYEPFKAAKSLKNQPRFHQEFHVLGSQFLVELRDKIYCQCNFGPFFDISDKPNEIEEIPSNTERPNPGFFFIHDTFYNDQRNPENQDYSEVILNWSKKNNYMRPFKSALMETTKFEDLKLRIGYPCVYQHQGACEHTFCITSIELLNTYDKLSRSSYPLIVGASKKRTMLCDICSKREVSHIVTDCALHVKDPIKICGECFTSYHYINGDTKAISFSAYKIKSIRPEKTE
ncbi:unnamed protein product [Diamesa serratosioi]